MSWSSWIAACAALLVGCASAPREQSTNPDLSSDEVQKAIGSRTVGDFLNALCDQRDGEACYMMAVALQKEGGPENTKSAAEYRAKACQLGYTEACRE